MEPLPADKKSNPEELKGQPPKSNKFALAARKFGHVVDKAAKVYFQPKPSKPIQTPLSDMKRYLLETPYPFFVQNQHGYRKITTAFFAAIDGADTDSKIIALVKTFWSQIGVYTETLYAKLDADHSNEFYLDQRRALERQNENIRKVLERFMGSLQQKFVLITEKDL